MVVDKIKMFEECLHCLLGADGISQIIVAGDFDI